MIALAIFARPISSCEFCYEDSKLPFAMVMRHRRTVIFDDVIEFINPDGHGVVLMTETNVPHFTTKIDDSLRLLAGVNWTVSRGGLAKCEQPKLRAKLATPALSLCMIGLQYHLSFFGLGPS
jgi:hypothetical protein